MAVAHALRSSLLPPNKIAEPQPLLRSPFATYGHAISCLNPEWEGPANSSERHLQIREMIIGGAVGGAFWQKSPDLPVRPAQIVVLPRRLSTAKLLWSTLLRHSEARSLLVLYPPSRELKPLLEEILSSAAGVLPAGNPHPVLEIANAIHAAEPCDLGLLAALAGIPSLQLAKTGFEALSPERVSARLAEGTSYTNPYDGEPAEIEEIAEILGDWQRMFQRNRAIAACTGISLWKRRRLAQLLHDGESSPHFHRSGKAALQEAAAQGKAIAVWTTRLPRKLSQAAERANIPLIRLEDGFIRSAGLGSGLLPPASIVADKNGSHFDPRQPSDLEILLEKTRFSESLLQRARRLIALLTSNQISKYGSAGEIPALSADPAQRIILVPGQVADDQSLQFGATGRIGCNISLLREVRRRNPDAFIVYRPHPDVMAGHRNGAIHDPVGQGLADQEVPLGAIAALIARVDEVHSMTSLAGFEALLRGKRVETFGQPFYAGWGLTHDHLPVARRQRRLRLEELAAGALILYPNYIDPLTGLPCGPEMLIARLLQPELWRPGKLMRLRRLQGVCRRQAVRWAKTWNHRNA